MQFSSVLHLGYAAYLQSNASEENKEKMELLIRNWIHKRNINIGP